MIKIYNTLTKQVDELKPRQTDKIQMFVCGPTVYDHIHIGNARTFVFFDVVAKYLKHKGYGVNYIQNITDIDNKIIERAEKEGLDPIEYAKKYTEIFKEDMKALGVTSPEYKNATDHISEVIKQVQTLLDKGNAYVIDGDGIYFDLSTFPDYGKLSGRTANMADDAVSRIDDSDKKRSKGDFAIWKFKQHNDPSWPAPFGEGRPGWHIEDTAITEKYFGPQYDIHGGGQDLIFPHHEAEIAQQESASGLIPFVKYWMHGGFLVNKEAKMSKSAGNFQTVHELLKKYPKEVLRFYLLSAHYRSPLDFSEEILEAAKQGIDKIQTWLGHIELIIKEGQTITDEDRFHTDNELKSFTLYFENAMADDLNIPCAIGTFFTLINSSNIAIQNKKLDAREAEKIKNWLIEKIEIFGIIPAVETEIENRKGIKLVTSLIVGTVIPSDIKDLAIKREDARRRKDFNEADKNRKEIELRGFKVTDTTEGTINISPSPSPSSEEEN